MFPPTPRLPHARLKDGSKAAAPPPFRREIGDCCFRFWLLHPAERARRGGNEWAPGRLNRVGGDAAPVVERGDIVLS